MGVCGGGFACSRSHEPRNIKCLLRIVTSSAAWDRNDWCTGVPDFLDQSLSRLVAGPTEPIVKSSHRRDGRKHAESRARSEGASGLGTRPTTSKTQIDSRRHPSTDCHRRSHAPERAARSDGAGLISSRYHGLNLHRQALSGAQAHGTCGGRREGEGVGKGPGPPALAQATDATAAGAGGPASLGAAGGPRGELRRTLGDSARAACPACAREEEEEGGGGRGVGQGGGAAEPFGPLLHRVYRGGGLGAREGGAGERARGAGGDDGDGVGAAGARAVTVPTHRKGAHRRGMWRVKGGRDVPVAGSARARPDKRCAGTTGPRGLQGINSGTKAAEIRRQTALSPERLPGFKFRRGEGAGVGPSFARLCAPLGSCSPCTSSFAITQAVPSCHLEALPSCRPEAL